MTTYTYGQGANDYVEVPDLANPGQRIRPPAGTPLQVLDARTSSPVTGLIDGSGSPVATVYSLDGGYLSFGCDSPSVLVSADGGDVFRLLQSFEQIIATGTSSDASVADLQSRMTVVEAEAAQIPANTQASQTATENAQAALTAAQNAATAAAAAQASAGSAVQSVNGTDPDTLGNVSVTIPTPDEVVIKANPYPSGDYPFRSTRTTNVNQTVIWKGVKEPSIGGGYAQDGVDEWRAIVL